MSLKEYRCRKHFRWGQILLPFLFAGAVVVFWGFLLQQDAPYQQLYEAFGVSVGVLLLCSGIWYLFYWLGGIVVGLDEEGLTYKNRLKAVYFPLHSIKHVRCLNIPYMGGWIKIIAEEKHFTLTVAIRDIAGFLKQLKESLDTRGMAHVYDKKQYFAFYKTSQYADQSWGRIHDHFGRIIIYSLSAILFCAAVIIYLRLKGQAILLGLLAAMVYAPSVYMITEMQFLKELARRCDEGLFHCPGRDIQFEKKLYREFVLKGMILYFGIVAVLLLMRLAEI